MAVSQLAPKDVLSPKQQDSAFRPVSVKLTLCDCRSRRFEGVGKQGVSLRNALIQQSLPAVAPCAARVAGLPRPSGEESNPRRGVAGDRDESYLVDPASSHMLVSKIKPCMSKYKLLYCETANGSLNQLSSI